MLEYLSNREILSVLIIPLSVFLILNKILSNIL
jgi:hypothetical protein